MTSKLSPAHSQAILGIQLAISCLRHHRQHFKTVVTVKDYLGRTPSPFRDFLESDTFTEHVKMIEAALDFLDKTESINDNIPRLQSRYR